MRRLLNIFRLLPGKREVSLTERGSLKEKKRRIKEFSDAPNFKDQKSHTGGDASVLSGSFTVEASLIMPIVLFLTLFVMTISQIMIIEWGVSYSIDSAARDIALFGGFSDNYKENTAVPYSAVLLAMERIKENDVPYQFVEGSFVGFDFGHSALEKNWVNLRVDYRVRIPFPILKSYAFKISQEAKARRFSGYDPEEDCYDNLLVYVTPTGTAYHLNKNCTYLNPSIRPVSKAALTKERNLSGAKYYPCERCSSNGQYVYITDYGTVYHGSVSCSSLKRTIMTVRLRDAPGYHACHKCAGGSDGGGIDGE